MAQFVETSQGFINLDAVKTVTVTGQGYGGPYVQVAFIDEEEPPRVGKLAYALTGQEAGAFIAHLRTVGTQIASSS